MAMMSDDKCYEILAARDTRYAEDFFVGVVSTGIFCRPGCPARLPKRENCTFYQNAQDALSAGFRACKRCHPASTVTGESALVRQLIELVEQDPETKYNEDALKALGIDPSTARRQFQKRFGMSFTQYARFRRLALAAQSLSKGESVINAQLDAGYESASGFRTAFAKTFGQAPKDARPDPLFIEWIETTMGRMIAICDDVHLYMLEFTDRKNMTKQFEKLRKLQKRAILPGRTKVTDQIEAELQAYFAGELMQFKTPLATSGTDFQDRTWEQLQNIPHGETRSYAQLATMVGDPKAVRAVAGANSKNGLAIIIPCHRVIASDGGLGGYAGGVSRKAKLLDLETAAKPD